MVEVMIEEMSASDGNRPKDYKRTVVVEAEAKEETRKTTHRSERSRALKKDLAGSTLLERPDFRSAYRKVTHTLIARLS